MIQIVEDITNDRIILQMKEMPPLSIGRIIDSKSPSNGHIVMRTSSTLHVEIMNLTQPGEDTCWTGNRLTQTVEMLEEGEEIILSIHNHKDPRGAIKRKRGYDVENS